MEKAKTAKYGYGKLKRQNTKFHIPKSDPSGFEEQLNSEQQQSAQF